MNIKKFIISIITLSISFFAACKNDQFKYDLVKVDAKDVDSIYFSPGDVMLIADGKATLKFVVETYKKFKQSDGTVVRKLFDYRKLPEGTLKIYEAVTNKEVGLTYSTTSMVAEKLKFYAQIGQVKSQVKEVILRPNPVLKPKIYVDVIFHVWELNPTNIAYDPSSYQPTNYADIVTGLKVMNDIINNKVGNGANAASANVEFRLATKNPAGRDMALPGYNKIVYSNEIKKVPSNPNINPPVDFPDYINKYMSAFIWNPKTYLNVHVLPAGSNYSFGNLPPAKQLPPGTGETLIPGISGIASDADDFVNSFTTSTLFMPNTLFRPGYERRIDIFNFIGAFYGLFETSIYTTSRYHSDYCEDTPEYNPRDPRNNFFFAMKTGLNGEKFVIENIMDDVRYPSSRNSLTLDQVNRMRAVMARCPGRMNSKTQ